ncbi:hypothetical protein F5877DRAFT_84705 [Lentinula edodes]|nr:hypothetical protein F5877DRAFT_84705 [Lentinula edodes]
MERHSFDSMLRFVRLLSLTVYTPRVDSYYDYQNHILHYDVEIPGVRRQYVKVTIGYSAILKQRNITVWGVSPAPHWPIQNTLYPADASSSTGGSDRPIATPNNGTIAPLQQTMERVHGEFYRLLAIPVGAQDINAVLSNGILSITIKCREPLTHTETVVTQEAIEDRSSQSVSVVPLQL